MNEKELQSLVNDNLEGYLDKRGLILYCGFEKNWEKTDGPTYYFTGFNPRPDPSSRPLRKIPQLLGSMQNWSAYRDACWQKRCRSNRGGQWTGCPTLVLDKHQKLVLQMMSVLGLNPEKTFSTNLIFVESGTPQDLLNIPFFPLLDVPSFPHLWAGCWRIHQEFLAEVKPDYVICLGNGDDLSAFSLLHEKAENRTPIIDAENNAHSRFRRFSGTLGGRPVKVVGVPHPSRPHLFYPPGWKLQFRQFMMELREQRA